MKLAGKFYLEYFDEQPNHDRCNDKCAVALRSKYGIRYFDHNLLPENEAIRKFMRFIGAR